MHLSLSLHVLLRMLLAMQGLQFRLDRDLVWFHEIVTQLEDIGMHYSSGYRIITLQYNLYGQDESLQRSECVCVYMGRSLTHQNIHLSTNCQQNPGQSIENTLASLSRTVAGFRHTNIMP